MEPSEVKAETKTEEKKKTKTEITAKSKTSGKSDSVLRSVFIKDDDIVMLEQLVGNIQELHGWQNHLLTEISRKVKAISSAWKKAKTTSR